MFFKFSIFLQSFYTFYFITGLCLGQRSRNEFSIPEEPSVTWCVVRPEELKKCQAFSVFAQQDRYLFGRDYIKLECYKGGDRDDCMAQVDRNETAIMSVDAGDVFVGGRYHSLVPILQEILPEHNDKYFAVAVVKSNTLRDVTSLRHLRGKKACFPSVGSFAGWVIPIDTLMRLGKMEVVDCNNHVKNAITYFGPSCAVNSLQDKYNPIGDNSDKLCQLCSGQVTKGKCTDGDPYAGFTGAFRCLVEVGEVAFLQHNTALHLLQDRKQFPNLTKDSFELLCPTGSRRPIDDYADCHWGEVPSNAIVTSSAAPLATRRLYQKFLQKAVQMYGGDRRNSSSFDNRYNNDRFNNRDQNDFRYDNRNTFGRYDPYSTSTTTSTENYDSNVFKYDTFNIFESSPRYGLMHDLLFTDSAEGIKALEEVKQTYPGVLGEKLELIFSIRKCPVGKMSLCVTSDPELIKCIKMRTALKAQLMKPDMTCYKGHSHIHCMQAIRNGDADVAVLEAGDIYTAGLHYDLIPFMSEVYNLGLPEYYAVAVAKEEDPSTDITYLRGKYTCHPGVNTGAGWVIPMAFLLSNGWIRGYGCDAMKAAATFFGKSCVPGALSTEYNTGVPYDNMCHLCHGSSYNYCRRDAAEDYFGPTGALRCLVEGGGEVAFVRHTTVMENVGGKRREWWARNTLADDFQLLCTDGTRTSVSNYEKCNLGKVKANAIVTRGGEGYSEKQISAFINLFIYAQQYYGRKDPDDFNFALFYSKPPYSDLIFQDATTQLKVIPRNQREYSSYLGKDFMRAKRIVDCFAGGPTLRSSPTIISFFLATLAIARVI